jgi:hypothetical protein
MAIPAKTTTTATSTANATVSIQQSLAQPAHAEVCSQQITQLTLHSNLRVGRFTDCARAGSGVEG